MNNQDKEYLLILAQALEAKELTTRLRDIVNKSVS